MQALGFQKLPVTVIGDRAILGFNKQALSELLNLQKSDEQRLATPWLFQTFDRILGAVTRAARQVPPDHLMWRTPDRDRPFKVFCYHIVADPNHVLDAISNGRYDGSFKLTYVESSDRFQTMEEVARFGEQTRARVAQAARTLTAEELSRPIEGYAGPTNGHELLHLVLSHTAHHLKQLYEMLRMISVPPTDPLGEEDFAGIRMPKDLW